MQWIIDKFAKQIRSDGDVAVVYLQELKLRNIFENIELHNNRVID